MAEKMDRGTEAMKTHLGNEGLRQMEVRQTRKGWCQEIMGCEALTEFRYYPGSGDEAITDENQVFHSLEDTDCFCRICCTPIHPFKMQVKEKGTDAEILTVDRPCACAAGACKCCCYQEATVTSGTQELGTMKETCWYCVPSFKVYDGATKEELYVIHPPTCVGGMCMNCCAEGNPCCGKGCCKVPFHVFPAGQANTDGDAPFIGKILKKPKSLKTELFTDANAFEITFPEQATADQKALLIGSSIFLNAVFFEGQEEGG